MQVEVEKGSTLAQSFVSEPNDSIGIEFIASIDLDELCIPDGVIANTFSLIPEGHFRADMHFHS